MRHTIRVPAFLRVVFAAALIGVLLLNGSTAVSADTIMLFDRFDGVTPPALPGGWATTSVVGSGCAWATQNGTVQPAGYDAHSAPNVVYMNASSCTAGYSARLYRTSGINLTSVSTASVSFYMFRDVFKPDNNDLVQMQVSTDGGATWQYVGTPISRVRNGVSKWQMYTVDISDFTGAGMADVRIAFVGVSQGGNDLHLDDITLTIGQYILSIPLVYKDFTS